MGDARQARPHARLPVRVVSDPAVLLPTLPQRCPSPVFFPAPFPVGALHVRFPRRLAGHGPAPVLLHHPVPLPPAVLSFRADAATPMCRLPSHFEEPPRSIPAHSC